MPSKYSISVQCGACSKERPAFLPNTVTCSRSLQHTISSLHWESGMYGNTGWALSNGSLFPRVPRVVLKSNSQYGQQDLQNQDARSSWEPSCDAKSYGETCKDTVDYRTSGVPLSAVEQQDTTRENKVKKLIKKFENHKHEESFLQNLSHTQQINKFRRESQDLVADLNNTEIFELCENSSEEWCPDCNAYCFNSPVSGVKVSWSKFLIFSAFHHGFQLLIVGNLYLLMNLHVVQFQHGFELRRLKYPEFVQTFQNINGWNFWHRQ